MKGATKNGPIRRSGESENLHFCCCFILGLNEFPVTFKYADPETRSSFVVFCQIICAAPLAGRCSLAYEIIVSSTDCHVFCTAPLAGQSSTGDFSWVQASCSRHGAANVN